MYRKRFADRQNIYHHYRYDLFWTLLLHDLASNHDHWWCYCFLSIYYGTGESHLKIKFYIGVYPGALRRRDSDDSLFALTVPWPSSHVDNFYLCFSSLNQLINQSTSILYDRVSIAVPSIYGDYSPRNTTLFLCCLVPYF